MCCVSKQRVTQSLYDVLKSGSYFYTITAHLQNIHMHKKKGYHIYVKTQTTYLEVNVLQLISHCIQYTIFNPQNVQPNYI